MLLFFHQFRSLSTTQTLLKKSLPRNYTKVKRNGYEVIAYSGKLKSTQKRAKHLMNTLNDEIVEHHRKTLPRLQQGEDIHPGDAVEILYKETALDQHSSMASGVLIGTRRLNSVNASYRLLTMQGDQKVEFHFPVFSPLITEIRLSQRNFIHYGTNKRVGRAKLYYLRNRPPNEIKIPPSEKTLALQEQKVIDSRKASYEARMGKKEKAEKAEREAKEELKKVEKKKKQKAKKDAKKASAAVNEPIKTETIQSETIIIKATKEEIVPSSTTVIPPSSSIPTPSSSSSSNKKDGKK